MTGEKPYAEHAKDYQDARLSFADSIRKQHEGLKALKARKPTDYTIARAYHKSATAIVHLDALDEEGALKEAKGADEALKNYTHWMMGVKSMGHENVARLEGDAVINEPSQVGASLYGLLRNLEMAKKQQANLGQQVNGLERALDEAA